MSEPARLQYDEPLAAPGQPPSLHVVSDVVDTSVRAGRWALVGYLLGFLVTGAALTIGLLLAGRSTADALGLGLFIGAWGGGGFGCMIGAILPYALAMEDRPHPPAPPGR